MNALPSSGCVGDPCYTTAFTSARDRGKLCIMDSCKASRALALVGPVGIRPTSGARCTRDSSYRPMGCRSFPAVSVTLRSACLHRTVLAQWRVTACARSYPYFPRRQHTSLMASTGCALERRSGIEPDCVALGNPMRAGLLWYTALCHSPHVCRSFPAASPRSTKTLLWAVIARRGN